MNIHKIKYWLNSNVPQPYYNKLQRFYYFIKILANKPRCFYNKYILLSRLVMLKSKLHIGCGNVRIPGFLNVDYRATDATDIEHDCTDFKLFKDNTFDTIFSNAFFEHIHIEKRFNVLKETNRLLTNSGSVVFAGIPDFERIAIAYLNKEKGITTKIFDITQVYRYTHGNPESTPEWWLEQLHKSLFDVISLESLLILSKFTSWIIFRYCFDDETIPVQFCFIAFKSKIEKEITPNWIKTFMLLYGNTHINFSTIEILSIKNG